MKIMSKKQLTTFPAITKDEIDQIAVHRGTLITSYRNLVARNNHDCEIVYMSDLQVNQLNQQLFSLFVEMVGQNQEHATIVLSFFNCTLLTLKKIHDLNCGQFNQLNCNQFVGFKSHMSKEDILNALDGEIRESGHDICHDVKLRFSIEYWLEIWRFVQSNFYQTRLSTDLDNEVLEKLALSSADQVIRFAHDARQSFQFRLDIEQILSFEKYGGQLGEFGDCLQDNIPELTLKIKKNEELGVQMTVDSARIHAEERFLNNEKVLNDLQRYHCLCQGSWFPPTNQSIAKQNIKLVEIPSVVDYAAHLIQEAKVTPLRNKRQMRIKRQLGHVFAALHGSRTHVRLFCGLPDSIARTVHAQGVNDGVIMSANLPNLNSSRCLWEILISQFCVLYGKLVDERAYADVVIDAVLEAWLRLVQNYSKPELALFAPYVTNLGLFLDVALWLREGRLHFEVCPHCQTVYVQPDIAKTPAFQKIKKTPKKRRINDDPIEPLPTGPYCRRLAEL